MPSWLERWHKRQRELAQGADADLMRANRRRFRVALGLIGGGLALGAFGRGLHLPSAFDMALRVIRRRVPGSDLYWASGQGVSGYS